MSKQYPKCTVRGHDHDLRPTKGSWLECPKGNYRWTKVKDELLPLPPFLQKNTLVFQETTYIRHTIPHWGWPSNWGWY